MNIENWCGIAKRYLLWPLLLPILGLVLLDYVQVLSWFLRIWICAYMVAWWLGAAAGLIAGLATRLDHKSHWARLFDYRIAHVVPSIKWGYDFVFWALEPLVTKDAPKGEEDHEEYED